MIPQIRSIFVFLVGLLLSGSLRAEFYAIAGPTFSNVKLLRRSTGLEGFSFGAGHRWSSFSLEFGFERTGSTIKNFYGEELVFSDDLIPDSREKLDVKLEYALASWHTEMGRHVYCDIGLGVVLVESKLTAMARNFYSGVPAHEFSYSNSVPIARVGLGIKLVKGFRAGIYLEAFQARAAPEKAILYGTFGNGMYRVWTALPQLQYQF